MTFPEADEFNAVHGTKFIADLMPRSPIYVALLTDEARSVIGQPHPSGRAALRMLEQEGFSYDRYVDIFDGGPTVTAPTDEIRTVRESRSRPCAEIGDGGRTKMLVAAGRLKDFRACCASVKKLPKKGVMHRPEGGRAARGRGRRQGAGGRALMTLREINFDGIVGPSHNYAGLSLGNLASTRNAGPGVAAARGGARRGSTRCAPTWRSGWRRACSCRTRGPNRAWLAELGTTIEEAEPALAANAMSASAMWAANAATVSPAPDSGDGKCHLTVANLRTMPHRSHEWPATLAQLRLAFAERCVRGARAGPAGVRRRGRGQSHAAGAGARRARGRDFRLWRVGRRLSRAPAHRSVEGDRAAPPARSRARHCSSSSRSRRSPPARSTTTSSRSPTSACCSRTSRRSPTRRR